VVAIQSLIQSLHGPIVRQRTTAFKTLGDRSGLVAAAALHAPQPTLPARGINGEVGWTPVLCRDALERQGSAVTGRSSDEENRRGWPIAVIWRRYGDRPDRQPVVTRGDHGIIRPEGRSRRGP
jgi:hypothetical protein